MSGCSTAPAASRLFNQRGIEGASLDDIGAEVGATKGAIYHYFDDKADLVARCYRRAFELYDLIIDTAVDQGRDGLDKALITLHLNVQAQGWFEFTNTSINPPQNTLKAQLNIR